MKTRVGFLYENPDPGFYNISGLKEYFAGIYDTKQVTFR